MITSYIIILCLSTWMLAAGLCQAAKRLAKLLGPAAAVPPALCVVLPIIGFLVVVAAAPAMLVAALLLLVVQVALRGEQAQWVLRFGVLVVAALLAASSIDYPEIAQLPAALLGVAAAGMFIGLLLAAERLPAQLDGLSMGITAALVPLLAAPFMGAPSSIALDVALIASGLLAALMALPHATWCAQARAPLTLIMGWLIIESAAHGAWLSALLSALVFAGAVAYGMMRGDDRMERYAL